MQRREIGAFRLSLWTAIVAVFVGTSAPASAQTASGPYRLTAGDRITVTVFGQPELSGDVVVDAGGNIVLPLIDPVEVKGLTVFEAQKEIKARLANGLLKQPSVSVRIAELRPLYVLGDVRTPGLYPFRYGSTVQSAVALAGGFGPNEPVQSTAAGDFLAAEERVRQLDHQRKVLLVRAARLGAQMEGQETFSFQAPSGLPNDPEIVSTVASEQDTLATQTALMRRQVELLRSQKPRLERQIEALNQQVAAGKKQLAMVNEQVERYDRLVKQGLGTSTSDFQFRVTQSTQEGALWRLIADVSRLQMEVGDLDFKIQDAETTFRRQTATELREVRDRLGDLEVTLPTAREIRDVKLQYAGALASVRVKRTITVTRMHDGHASVIEADETTVLEPGDTIEIRRFVPEPVRAPRSVVGAAETDTSAAARPKEMAGADATPLPGPVVPVSQ